MAPKKKTAKKAAKKTASKPKAPAKPTLKFLAEKCGVLAMNSALDSASVARELHALFGEVMELIDPGSKAERELVIAFAALRTKMTDNPCASHGCAGEAAYGILPLV